MFNLFLQKYKTQSLCGKDNEIVILLRIILNN